MAALSPLPPLLHLLQFSDPVSRQKSSDLLLLLVSQSPLARDALRDLDGLSLSLRYRYITIVNPRHIHFQFMAILHYTYSYIAAIFHSKVYAIMINIYTAFAILESLFKSILRQHYQDTHPHTLSCRLALECIWVGSLCCCRSAGYCIQKTFAFSTEWSVL